MSGARARVIIGRSFDGGIRYRALSWTRSTRVGSLATAASAFHLFDDPTYPAGMTGSSGECGPGTNPDGT
jgi:hypothetical protein